MNITSKFNNCFFGLAVGDALGCTLEFKKPGTFEPITTIVGGGVHKLEAGQWTDDTSLALCFFYVHRPIPLAERLMVHYKISLGRPQK